MSRNGAVVGGRWTYEAAGHWGDENPWGLPFFIVTHRPEEEPAGGAFTFVAGVEEAVERAVDAAGDKDVSIMGGADVIRQALEAGLVDELTIIVAPVVLGAGKRLFDGFTESLELEHLGVRQSAYATFIDYPGQPVARLRNLPRVANGKLAGYLFMNPAVQCGDGSAQRCTRVHGGQGAQLQSKDPLVLHGAKGYGSMALQAAAQPMRMVRSRRRRKAGRA